MYFTTSSPRTFSSTWKFQTIALITAIAETAETAILLRVREPALLNNYDHSLCDKYTLGLA